MSRITVIISLVIIAIAIFLAATFLFDPTKLASKKDSPPLVSSNFKLDCTGFWEGNPLCEERNNAIRALQELESSLIETESIINKDNELKFQSSKVIKNEGDNFFREEFYFKAEKKYKEALDVLNIIKNENQSMIQTLKDKALLAYKNNNLDVSLELFKELKDLTNSELAKKYIIKINNRTEILKLNKEAEESLKDQKFDNAKITIFKSINLDREYEPSIRLKDIIIEKEREFLFNNFINDSFKSIEKLEFKEARQSLSNAKNLFPDSLEVSQLENRLNRIEKENKIMLIQYEIDTTIKNEEWEKTLRKINDLENINQGIVDKELKARIKKIIRFMNIANIHITKPGRLSSKNVLNEAIENYDLGQELADQSTPELLILVESIGKLIEQYSTRVNITFISNNETYLDIERFKSFEPFTEFTISVRPGNYVFTAKKPGIEAERKEYVVKFTDSDLVVSVVCDNVCYIN